jgi:putative ABC transport system permease protein
MIPFAPAAKAEIPELQSAVRISHRGILSAYKDKKFYERALFVDNNFFRVFSFPFIKGDPATALVDPNTIVITQNISEKYFGDENPVGKTLTVDNNERFVITGVIKNLPFNSHIQDDIFASFNSYNETNFPRLNSWGSFSNDFTYVMLKPGVNPADVEKKLNAVMKFHTDEPFRSLANIKMQKLTDVHFSKLIHDDAQTTPLISLYIFGAIGIFILLIASINFINLTTARASRRNKEIGIRKVSGAGRFDLVLQFLSEAFALTIISAAVALVIAAVLIPQVNSILKLHLSLGVLYDFNFLMLTAAVLLFTAFTAGAYPAFVLSKPEPALILKKNVVKKGGYSLRAVLVVLQFAISVFLIIATFTVFNQIDFMLSKNLGFPKDQIVVLNNNDENILNSGMAFKHALLNGAYVKAASYSSGTPGSNTSSTSNFTPEGGGEKDEIIMQVIDVDYDFLNTFDLRMKQGRFFSRDFSTDTSDAYICLLYTSPSPRDRTRSRMPSSA